jgi:hypothetical protein
LFTSLQETVKKKGYPMAPEEQKERNDLAGEHTLGDAGQIILACLYAAIWVLDTFFLNYTTVLNNNPK